jgi:hypothetical protein
MKFSRANSHDQAETDVSTAVSILIIGEEFPAREDYRDFSRRESYKSHSRIID